MSLRAEAVSVVFGSAGTQSRALDRVDFDVARGEVLGIAGASAAGKSLIAAALAGIAPPDARQEGRITTDGRPPGPRDIALAPQRLDALDPLATLGCQIRRLSPRRIDAGPLLERVGLSRDHARHYPHTLSGGMARRALLATALATGTQWIVVDEPTVGLDRVTADRIMALLGSLAAEGRGLVVISHDLPRLVRLADRVLILRDGAPVETAPATAFDGDGHALESAFSKDLWRAQLPC